MKRKTLAIVLCFVLIFTVVQGITIGSVANAAGVNIFGDDPTFETATVGDNATFFNVQPGATPGATSTQIISGGAFGTSKAVTILAPWKVALKQERVGYATAGKFYELSAWHKGSTPYNFKLNVYNGSSYVSFPMPSPAVSSTWQYVAMRFTAPAGAGAGVQGADGPLLLNLQAGFTDFSVDEIMLKEVDSLTLPPAPTPPPTTPTPIPTATPTPDPNATPAPVKIMCIGDSITQGSGGTTYELSYRYPLWKLLIDNNANVEFVGSRNYGFNSTPTYADYKGQVFNNRNEGYWGWTIQGVNDIIGVPLQTIIPDIAIIYLGTNGSESAAQKTIYMQALIETLRAANPKIKILLGEPSQTALTALQASFKALAASMTTTNSPVFDVKNATPWGADCTIDGAHTSLIGDQRMADNIYPVLAQALANIIPPTPTPGPTSAVTPSPTITPTQPPTTTPTPTPSATPTPTPTPIAVTSIKLNTSAKTLKVPLTLQLTATILPANAADKKVKWSSSNTKIATVSTSGKVTAKAPGVCTITATASSGKTATCKVTVIQPVKSVKLNKTSLSILKGKTSKLVPTINPSNASNKKVIWKSSNKAIATVSSNGTVKGIKKGTCYITVTTVDGKKSAKCKVIVK